MWRTGAYSLWVPTAFPSRPFLGTLLPLFPFCPSPPEWGRISPSDLITICIASLWSPWTVLPPLGSSLALPRVPLDSSQFYDVPLDSMMTRLVVLIPPCHCISSLRLFFAIQGILSRPSRTLSPSVFSLIELILALSVSKDVASLREHLPLTRPYKVTPSRQISSP